MLQIPLAILIAFILIKFAQHFDKIASEIDVIRLVIVTAVVGIIFNLLSKAYPIADLLALPAVFGASAFRLRKYEFQSWGRTLIYSFLVICSLIISSVILNIVLH